MQQGNQNRPPNNGRPAGMPQEENARHAPQARSFTQYQSNSTRPFNAIPYSEEETNAIQGRLNKVLGPEYVSFRPGTGGSNVSYIEGWKALNLANDIFGFNGWSSELISVSVDFLDVHNNGRVSLGLSVVARITLKDGTFHEDFGYGFIENAKNKAMAFEKCKKEAFTDGLKRCLRCFGNVLGNCLYDKTIIGKMQKVKAPPRELEHSDFHRDPLVLKRETNIQRKQQQPQEQQTSSVKLNQNPNATSRVSDHSLPRSASVPPKPSAKAGPPAIKSSDFKDLDDSFQFSDELGEEELNDRLDDYELELLKHREVEAKNDSDPASKSDDADDTSCSTPGQVFFTSSKKALDVQKSQDPNSIPVYDHKFISSGVRRTIDPSKSVKVRRSDTVPQTPPTATQSGIVSPSVGTGPGKRPLGMPPGQRQPIKRLHKDVDDPEKENKIAKQP
ncbi:hypothetical protein FT663_02543 [Candidozyma haemuli var. vulneris]|uniref:DNA repair and recombination protein RAD52 n=1 Tax=Candidozyma haemuli TaxID=45357 RepID=A0A2V1AMK2_9ASCO|nr:hypothetical protein CXQ85_001373 [[Candida] haemuloni]KAF3989717.1 hypothetical protein FT662_02692 [[Candida] haemuloni var. vulneris]KAF3991921.1 hypothetical protein FT663_02543 [[Candida] haemuloni var. vulneris]PVH19078.1 hypothetical protein CXQ85_001373 [[Candida] haemuloni]